MMGPTHSQQQSICIGGGLNSGGNICPSTPAAKHPRKQHDHQRGKATADGANTLLAAKHLQEGG